MRSDDLAPFAVADGLLAQIAQEPAGRLTDTERRYLLDHARENLARATGETIQMAGRAKQKAAAGGEFTLQAGQRFAYVSVYGCLLYVISRIELRAACHPGTN